MTCEELEKQLAYEQEKARVTEDMKSYRDKVDPDKYSDNLQQGATNAGCLTNYPKEYEICDALKQLVTPRWDGNLNSKTQRDYLVKQGLVERTMGWNFLTARGIELCITLKILVS